MPVTTEHTPPRAETPEASPPANLTAETFHGLKWSYTSTIVNTLLQVVFVAIMARLLSPSAFGLMAMAGLVLHFGSYFAQMGVGSAIVQKQTLSKDEIHAAFLLSTGLGFLVAAVVWTAAPAAALLFGEPAIVPLIRVMALSFIVSGLSISAYSLLRRNLNFRAISIIDILSYVLGYGLVGLGMAYHGFGVWSLVGAALSVNLVTTVLAHLLAGHGVSFVRRWACYQPLFSFGSRISLISIFEYVGSMLDTAVIGRVLGASSLGLYNRGQQLVRMPMYQLSSSFSRVLMPSFSRIQTDIPRLRKAYLTALTLVSAVLVPACVGLSVAAHEAVLLLLGPQWTEAIPLLQILAFGVAFDILTHFGGITCEATATLNIKILIQVLFIALLGLLLYLLQGFGLVGFAVAVLAAQFVRHLAYVIVMKHLLVIRLARLCRAYLPALVNSSIIGGALYVAALGLRGAGVSAALSFGAEVALGAGLLILLILFSPVGDVRRETIAVLMRIDTSLALRAAHLLQQLDAAPHLFWRKEGLTNIHE